MVMLSGKIKIMELMAAVDTIFQFLQDELIRIS